MTEKNDQKPQVSEQSGRLEVYEINRKSESRSRHQNGFFTFPSVNIW